METMLHIDNFEAIAMDEDIRREALVHETDYDMMNFMFYMASRGTYFAKKYARF